MATSKEQSMRFSRLPARALAVILAGFLAAAPALADRDHGGRHGDKHERKADKHERKAEMHERKAEEHRRKAQRHAYDDGPRRGHYFEHRHRDVVRHYYVSYEGPRCPPGLVRKGRGCMPPGHAKRWHVGERLPTTVVTYAVPQPILVTLPPPPPRHKYVRVAGDILLIAVGTSLVVDGIDGLMN
jgi:Ni/Co efflux regulator RcnB